MKKFFIFLALILIISGSGYLLVQKYILPALVLKLEKFIVQNTPYKIQIKNLNFKFNRVKISEIKIDYNGKVFSCKKLDLNFNLLPLLSKKASFQGRGRLEIKEEKFKFKITRFLYNQNTGALELNLYFPEKKLISYLEAGSFFYSFNPEEIKIIHGSSDLYLTLKKTEALNLKLLSKIKDIDIKYNEISLHSPILNCLYKMEADTRLLKVQIKGFTFTLSGKEFASPIILKQGEFSLETDFEKIKLSEIKFKTKETLWEGNISGDNIRTIPNIVFNFNSNLCSLSGDIQKREDSLRFKYKLTREQDSLEGEGSYDLKTKDLRTQGNGRVVLGSLNHYLKLNLPQAFKTLNANLDIKDYLFYYNKVKNILTFDSNINIHQLKLANFLIANKGKINLKIKNKKLEIENLILEDKSGEININGLLNLTGKIPFQAKVNISNYNLRTLYSPFIEQDIGKALLSGKGYLNGEIKQPDSLEAVMIWDFKEGNIGKLKFFSQIASFLGKSELEEINFSSGKGQLELRNRIAKISKTYLLSPYLNLFITGTIGLNGSLDLTLITEFTQAKPLWGINSPWGKLGDILFEGLKEVFYKIHITGNIKNPKYTLMPATVDRILKEFLPSYR